MRLLLKTTCAVLGTLGAAGIIGCAESGSVRHMTPTAQAASMAPHAPRVWPVCPLVLLTGTSPPSTAKVAWLSTMSPTSVAVA